MKSPKTYLQKIISNRKVKSSVREFQKFAFRGHGMDVAVGMVIGTAFSTLIQTTVSDIVMPIIGIFSKQDYKNYSLRIGKLYIPYGSVLSALINFLLIALVVFLFIKIVNNLSDAREEAKQYRVCPYCLSTIPRQATRCSFCTSRLPKLEPLPEEDPDKKPKRPIRKKTSEPQTKK